MLKFLKRTKGKTLNKTAQSILGLYLKKKDLGELKNFDINMDTRELNISFLPKHFNDTLTIQATNYNIMKDEKNGKNYLTFDSITTSNNWDNSRFQKLIKNRRIKIPEKYYKLVELVA